ncbi:PilW family protein [Alteribacter natronophilus]|uniref:PilW family protein n=1 Tax=Alteribacter natronophilus TaxID=2583810 RepID=UPI00110D69E2|nr:hypothetical protein [Alteribacter natronophilus]TMW72050.1 hypothetical protein FGB90_07460 [Alteribacter natronophilus]
MSSLRKDCRGASLVEVLTAFSLMGMILLIAFSFHFFGQNEYSTQSAEVSQQNEVRIALNVLTREIRNADQAEVDAENNSRITITSEDNTRTIFRLSSEGKLLRGENNIIASDIEELSFIEESGSVKVTIVGRAGRSRQTDITTEIFMRGSEDP